MGEDHGFHRKAVSSSWVNGEAARKALCVKLACYGNKNYGCLPRKRLGSLNDNGRALSILFASGRSARARQLDPDNVPSARANSLRFEILKCFIACGVPCRKFLPEVNIGGERAIAIWPLWGGPSDQ